MYLRRIDIFHMKWQLNANFEIGVTQIISMGNSMNLTDPVKGPEKSFLTCGIPLGTKESFSDTQHNFSTQFDTELWSIKACIE